MLAMVHAHVLDSWTREADRHNQTFYSLQWMGGVASALFLCLAGVALAMNAEVKGVRAARARGWEVFLLAFLFRLQAMVVSFGPPRTLLKVDMLNIMGLSMVVASLLWQLSSSRRGRLAVFAIATTATTLVTPLVRAVSGLAVLPDPIEAYLRPEGTYSAFALFPWAGFLFAGVIIGELVHAVRVRSGNPIVLHIGLLVAGISGVVLGWTASFRPALFPTASFWHDSPTLFFMRLGVVTLLVPIAWVAETVGRGAEAPRDTKLIRRVVIFDPLVTMGRSSLFVYWIHVEMVYGLIAEPIKRTFPLWGTELGWAALCYLLYRIVLWKNRKIQNWALPARFRILAPVLR